MTIPSIRPSENNVIWLVLYLLAIPAGLAIALFLNQSVGGIRLYKSLFFFPFVISQVVVGLMFTWFYAPDFGLLTALIRSVTGQRDRCPGRRAVRHLRHHRRGPLAADGLLHDPLPHRAQQPESGTDRGGPHGRRQGPRRSSGTSILPQLAPGDLHRHGRDRHRLAALLRPRLDHDAGGPTARARCCPTSCTSRRCRNTATAWATAPRSRSCCS